MDASKHQRDPQDFKVSRGYANYVFLLLFLLYLFNYVDRMVVFTEPHFHRLHLGPVRPSDGI
jgi:hypothetical protein